MVGLGILAALLVIGMPIAVIYLLVSHAGLKRSVADLEHKMRGMQASGDEIANIAATVKPAVPKAVLSPSQPQDAPSEPEVAAGQAATTDAAAYKSVPEQKMRIVAPKSSKQVPPPVAPPSGPNAMERFFAWLQLNWFYAVSALSLALAGLFLVQYGMENGLLPPAARVMSALAFGAVLIGVGEFLRRHFGEDKDSTTEYLPSVFAGAGIVSLFGGVLSAEMLYGLISPNTALIGMIIVATIALVLGWFYGALLAAVGIIGAFGAPLVLGGSNSDPTPLFGYFAIVAAVGLGMDSLRRWAWVSVLTLVLAFVMGWLLVAGDGTLYGAFAVYLVAIAVFAITIPARSIWPDHGGVMIASFALGRTKGEKPQFPTLLSGGAVAAASVGLVGVAAHRGEAEFWVAIICACVLAALLICWSLRAQALQDQVVAPIAALLIGVPMHANIAGRAYLNVQHYDLENLEATGLWSITTLVVFGAILGCLAAWRAQKPGRFGLGWAGVAALTAPVLAIALEMTWKPTAAIGAYPWALHAAALAALMVFWAERFARRDKSERRLRMSFFVLSALSCISFALVVIFSEAALTASLAITVVVAAALDRKFNLRPMTYFIAVGVVTIGYRLAVDPGLHWALNPRNSHILEVLVSHGGAVAGFVAALWLLPQGKRLTSRVMLDSAAWSGGGILISILLMRFLENILGGSNSDSHWAMGLYAVIWLGIALAQIQRLSMPSPRWLWMVRVGLSTIFGAIGLLALLAASTVVSPLLGSGGWFGSAVRGPIVFNTLLIAYLLPAGILALAVWRIKTLPRLLKRAMQALIAVLLVYWLFCVIRHFWQGAVGMPLDDGMSQPELYSYTIALLIAGAGLFYQSLARRSSVMRKAGLIVIGMAVAKVFLIDISGLEGLTRVFSLLVLGLSLAGLAWLNRWAQDQTSDQDVS